MHHETDIIKFFHEISEKLNNQLATRKTNAYKPIEEANFLHISFSPSPLGEIYYVTDNNHLYLVDFLNKDTLEPHLINLQKHLGKPFLYKDNSITLLTQKELREYFAHQRQEFTIPVRLLGTPFQLSVWKALPEIPYGSTWSYSEQATYIQRPQAVRAVARTNGLNRLTIIYPCHRVIGKNGHLTGYAGTLERKAWLLEHEKKWTLQQTY